jgi:hypothetical protein
MPSPRLRLGRLATLEEPSPERDELRELVDAERRHDGL